MDRNKLEELRRIGYRIPSTCGFCRHGEFPKDIWGTCSNYTYDHLKHSDAKRQLSIYKGGSCGSFALDEARAAHLGAFREFL